MEVIVVDNGSTDNSRDVNANYISRIHHEKEFSFKRGIHTPHATAHTVIAQAVKQVNQKYQIGV
jgi:hypothetical protein